MVYYLVSVPGHLKFELDYKQPSSRTDLQLGAMMEQDAAKKPVNWYVRGLLDSYTYEQLGLPTARESSVGLEGDGQPPLITQSSLAHAGEFGDLREIKVRAEGLSLYRVSLKLPPKNINAFLNHIWQPDMRLVVVEGQISPVTGENVPKVVVNSTRGSERILPVKYEPKTASFLPRLTLTVG